MGRAAVDILLRHEPKQPALIEMPVLYRGSLVPQGA